MSEESSRLPAEPISAVGVLASISQGPDGYYVVAKTTDGNDADLWKDGIFKSKVTRYLCFKRENGPDVVVDMRMIDAKDALPQGFTPVEKTEDTGETAMRKRKLCVKTSPRAAAKTAVYDIQITAKSKYQLIDYKCLCEMNNMVIWYRTGDVPQPSSQETSIKVQCDGQAPPVRRRNSSRPDFQHQGSGNYTMTALDDVPFIVSQNLFRVQEQFHYNFSTERSIAD
ncbi:multivesicular body subunit 12Bb isoform X2 [Takifugu flavidus]|uniref:multivesicular body subunit 12Bb isoform X2 n=1 Tax=Takifugu flavidus TaxID=433684 RepID=UPI0025446900|nr:multivesicular body subunit 12Bb isoform X2 [Takifugu flavidus]